MGNRSGKPDANSSWSGMGVRDGGPGDDLAGAKTMIRDGVSGADRSGRQTRPHQSGVHRGGQGPVTRRGQSRWDRIAEESPC